MEKTRVLKNFIDVEAGVFRKAGDTFEASAERIEKLARMGLVSPLPSDEFAYTRKKRARR